MIRIKYAGPIPRLPGVVFPLLADPLTQLDWDEDLRSVSRLDGGDVTSGSRFKVKIKGLGTFACEVVEYQPSTQCAYFVNASFGTLRHTFTLSAERGGTWLVQTGEFEPNLVGGLIRRRLRRRIQARFDALHRALADHLSPSATVIIQG